MLALPPRSIKNFWSNRSRFCGYGSSHPNLSQLQSLDGKIGQHEAGFVNLLVVVLVLFHLFIWADAPQRDLNIPTLILAADHEADLAARVSRDGRVRVLNDGEDLLANFLEVPDEVAMQPDTLPYSLCKLAIWTLFDRKGRYEPCVVITPPSFKAPFRSSKYGF